MMMMKDKKEKPGRYNKMTSKKHVMETIPFRVTKKTRKELWDNEDLRIAYEEVDNAMKNFLVAIANTPIEMYGLRMANMFMKRLSSKMKNLQKRENKKKNK